MAEKCSEIGKFEEVRAAQYFPMVRFGGNRYNRWIILRIMWWAN